ncbi:ATP-dependent Clp protease proteolytic subunit [Isoptericola variabilis 225]|uniref:ATP-dependent Clp protease proteolytic subunit n=1 Tax=Isoptericola variabilis (strain 225) TaxID=743718 RepID=F6FSP0_ISOV2|nr:ATP-dependent Clp protease proteolytic subunit [Isoptericola variabilis 225]
MASYTIPTVLEKTPLGERTYDVFSRLLRERIVFLGTEIDDGVANVVMAQLLHLESEAPEQEIGLYINSPGGSATAMTAIYHTMQFVRSEVSTICMGQAASAAAVLLAAGTPGKRYVLEHARVLLHQPSTQGQGTISDLAIQAREILRLRGETESLLARHTGRSVEQLRADTDRDLVLSAREAVEYGVADAVVSSRKLPARAARAGLAVPQAATSTASVAVRCPTAVLAARTCRTVAERSPADVRTRTPARSASTAARVACACATRSTSRMPSASQTAASTSDDASLRPRSTSERYAIDMRAAAATSCRVRPCRSRARRRIAPTRCRSSGSRTCSMRRRYPRPVGLDRPRRRPPSSFRYGQKRAPARVRTGTGPGLSRLPLPVGLRGRRAETSRAASLGSSELVRHLTVPTESESAERDRP